MDIKNYDTLFEKNGGIGLEKQFSLSEVIGDRNWQMDIDTRTLIFGGDITMDMEILGSYSYQSGTWLWIWANEQAGYPDAVTESARQFKAMGEEYNIEFLIKDEYKIEPIDVHALGIIASGEFNASAYYAGDYGEGIALMLVKSALVDSLDYNEEARILTTFPQLISNFTVNHRRALIAYLEAKGYGYTEKGKELVANKRGNEIVATFDNENRLSKLNGEIIK